MSDNIREQFLKDIEKEFRDGVGHYGVTLENYKQLGVWAFLYGLEVAAREAERLQGSYPTIPIDKVLLPEAIRKLIADFKETP